MIKKVFSFVLFFTLSLTLCAQDKLLTIQDAVLKGRTALAPKRLQSLSFINGTNKFAYVDNNTVKVGDNTNASTAELITLNTLNL